MAYQSVKYVKQYEEYQYPAAEADHQAEYAVRSADHPRFLFATVYIDLHRNTADVRRRQDDVVMVDGKRCARMFFVVGTSIGTYEGEYDTAHDWQRNYALAKAVTERLKAIDPYLATDIRLKVGRYNQHVSPYCMLIELGHNANTFEDAANSIPYLADALAGVLIWNE